MPLSFLYQNVETAKSGVLHTICVSLSDVRLQLFLIMNHLLDVIQAVAVSHLHAFAGIIRKLDASPKNVRISIQLLLYNPFTQK